MFRFVSLLLVFVCTANFLFAASPQKTTDAIVYGGAGVTVDDTIVSGSLVVFPGNVVETHDDHFADLKQPGSTIRLLGHSRAKYTGASIELLSGSAVVTSANAFIVSTPCYSVKSSSANARFSVVSYQGRIYVAAEKGSIEVKTATATRNVMAKTITISGCGTSPAVVQEVGSSDFIAKVIFGAAGAAAMATVVLVPKQEVSSQSPNPRH
jgi:hypothetical protein